MKKLTSHVDISDLILAGDTFTQQDFDALPIEGLIKHKFGSPASNPNYFENNTTYAIQGEAFVLLSDRKNAFDSGAKPSPINNLYWVVATSLLRNERTHGLAKVEKGFGGFEYLDEEKDDDDPGLYDVLTDHGNEFVKSDLAKGRKNVLGDADEELMDVVAGGSGKLADFIGKGGKHVGKRQARNILKATIAHAERGDLFFQLDVMECEEEGEVA